MDKVVSILKKKNKTLAELQILDKRFKTVKFFSESREKIDLDNFYK
jgi:CRP-like cAMP-binding protein